MALYIDDGVNVDPSWTKHIAVSPDGTNWTPIAKAGVNVKQRFIQKSLTSKHPWERKASHGMITLDRDEDIPIITFDPNDVVNQATWLGNTPAFLQIAVRDIAGWLGS